MNTYILLTDKSWHDVIFSKLEQRSDERWIRMRQLDARAEDFLLSIQPRFIFVPHWSRIIPNSIWEQWNVVVFHMTDLPFGRGGSPLQNLIVRGFKETKISAIRVDGGIDTGAIYLKRGLTLDGAAREIFQRSSGIITSMIKEIIDKDLTPIEQHGEVTYFKRRKREDGNCAHLDSLEAMHDYIRMLDCEGYPPAFLETEHFKVELTKSSGVKNNQITANVRITKK